jgi:hypothetical protein
MPRLSQWYVRLAMIYFLLGFTVGSLMLANKGIPFYPALWTWLPVHIELLLIGWIVQLTMGVAFWIMPRYWVPPRRGNETGARVAIVLLNVGVWLVITGSLIGQYSWLVLLGRLSEVGAGLMFAWHIWPRVVGREG